MDLDPLAPLVALPVEVEGPSGRLTLDMVLDTGATFVVLPTWAAREVGFEPAALRERVKLTTASSLASVPLLVLPSVRAMGLRRAMVQAVCLDLPPETPVGGLLGLSFLRHFDVDLHFRSRRLGARGR